MLNAALVGRLVADAETRQMPNGDPMLRLRVAVDRGAPKGETAFWDVDVFGKVGKIAEYLGKGRRIAVNGRAEQRRWEKDGVRQERVTIVTQPGSLELLDAPATSATADGAEPVPA